MSQYAIIPANKIGQVQESYSVASPNNWRFVLNGAAYGGMEENQFSTAQLAEINALGGKVFLSASLFNDWAASAGNPEIQVRAALSATDWAMLPDSGLSKLEEATVKAYRLQLYAMLETPNLDPLTFQLPQLTLPKKLKR